MHPRPARILLQILIFCCLVFSVSCGNSETSVISVYPRIIIAYESPDSEPDVFLSLYGEVNGDAMRLERMTVTHKDSGMYWSADALETISGITGQQTYIGYPTFRPYEKHFPAGSYTVTWYEKNGKNFTTDFSVTEQSLALPQEENTVTNVMLEDSNRRILYAGQQTSDFLSVNLVRAKYPEAELYRKYVLKSNTRVMYVYPPVYIRNNSENEY